MLENQKFPKNIFIYFQQRILNDQVNLDNMRIDETSSYKPTGDCYIVFCDLNGFYADKDYGTST